MICTKLEADLRVFSFPFTNFVRVGVFSFLSLFKNKKDIKLLNLSLKRKGKIRDRLPIPKLKSPSDFPIPLSFIRYQALEALFISESVCMCVL
jgi:hypothetical protein